MPAKGIRYVLRVLGRMQFIRFGIRDRIIRLFDSPDTARIEPFEVSFFRFRYPGNFATFIDWSVFYYGGYSQHELSLIRDIASFRHATFVDIGANVGHHSLFAAGCFDRVIAIEPFNAVSDQLNQKIARNRIDNITLLKHGLGLRDEILTFFPPQTQNSGTGSFVQEKNEGNEIQLRVRRGEDVMREQQVPPGAVIKIDTEGFEPLVMEGMADFISTQKPILFFEWSQNELKATSTQQAQSLLPDSYCCYLFLSHIPRLFFFERQSYGLKKIDGHWPDGMILAFDAELLQHESFKTFIESKTTVAGK